MPFLLRGRVLGVFRCLQAEMKVPAAYQNMQTPTGTASASSFCKIPQFLSNSDKNELAKIRGLVGVVMRVNNLLNFGLGIHLSV